MANIKKELALLLMLALVGCAVPRPAERSTSTESAEGSSPELLKLRHAEELWKHVAPGDYLLKVGYSTFVGIDGCSPQTFKVRGGRSVSLDPKACKSHKSRLASVPALFRLAEDILSKLPDDSRIEYDPKFGYPKTFYAGSTTMEDSYFSFDVLEFTPLTAQGEP